MVTTRRATIVGVMFAVFALTATVSKAASTVPTTVAEHEALAKQYRDQAAQYKKIADEHRAMAEAAKQSALSSHSTAQGEKDPKLVKMQKHCSEIAKDADKLAADDAKAADYHEMRAKELQGK